ncbi:MAG: hypothetical protein U0807_07135 [Candidatus Binatia bacterium]
MAPMTGREALLSAFERLFDAAAAKLNVICSAEERADAKDKFQTRFAQALELTSLVEVPEIPAEVVTEMESQIAQLSPADIAGVIASIPLAQQTQEMLRAFALKQAERRLLEHFASQAETRYGGN